MKSVRRRVSRRTLELLSQKKKRVPTSGTLLRKYCIMDIERPMVLRRNEGNKCQNRNSILSFYVDQRKCQAFCPAATKEYLEVDESSVWNNTASFGIIELRIIPNDVILFRMIKAYYSKRPFCARAILAAAPNQTSQTPRHIWWNAEDTVALDEIFGMDDIAAADSVLVLFAEAQK